MTGREATANARFIDHTKYVKSKTEKQEETI